MTEIAKLYTKQDVSGRGLKLTMSAPDEQTLVAAINNYCASYDPRGYGTRFTVRECDDGTWEAKGWRSKSCD